MTRTAPLTPILIVDDDESVLASVSLLLKQSGFQSLTATNPEQALGVLNSRPVSLVLQDMNFSRQTSGDEGMDLLQRIKSEWPLIPVILMTAWGSIELAVSGMKEGAADFVTKPWNNRYLLQLIETSLSLSAAPLEAAETTREELDSSFDFKQIVGTHPNLLKVLQTVARVAPTDAPVLILGESGTGKELIANAIHANSKRSEHSLVKVNLGGVPASLFESEMFGHVKGAFTDAKADRNGYFEQADNGTIFLDEAGDLDKASQVKLLRVLQDHTYQPLGASKTRQSNVRVVSATNANLEELVAQGQFREDLLYRLNLITIELPALRERRSDIRLLVEAHLTAASKTYGLPDLSADESALSWLENQPWPGNIRELKQTVERAVLMSGKSCLSREDFGLQASHGHDAGFAADLGQLKLDEVERLAIEQSLNQHHHNISKTAEALGISRAALYRRLEKHQITVNVDQTE